MISSNSFSSSSTTSSLSSGTDGKDVPMHFDESKLFQTQHNIETEFSNLTHSEMLEKDERYWERRRKNNAAAKRSRERRRQHDVAMERQIQNLKLANTILQNEIIILHNKLSLQASSIENTDLQSPPIAQKQKCIQVDDLSNLLPRSTPAFVGRNNLTDSTGFPCILPDMSKSCIEKLYSSEPFNLGQNPLDLSFKVKMESMKRSNDISKFHSRSNSETSNLDQRYWDRRRRNNEAVRKCRQNKKAKMQSNTNNTNNNIGFNNNVDKVQLKSKIESITNELLKLRSQLHDSEIISSDISNCKHDVKAEEEISPNHSQRINENYKKTMKWKNKLIEANQAEKEIKNQTGRV